VQGESIIEEKTVGGGWNEPLCMDSQKHTRPGVRAEALTIPELEQSKAAVLNTLASVHSRRSYTFAINRFIAWYCSEPRLTFNRALVVRYRSYLESLRLSASTINLHLSAIRRLPWFIDEFGVVLPIVTIAFAIFFWSRRGELATIVPQLTQETASGVSAGVP